MAPLEEGEENPMSSMTLGQFVPSIFFKKNKKNLYLFIYFKTTTTMGWMLT